MKSRQKGKKKGSAKERVFGCDLQEHLQHSGQEVPQVLKSCAEFVEEYGVVDGIYRLSGVSSNIQKLRQEFESERKPDLRRDVYLQDIHCVSSLCKAYFRELPDPLLTYRLYDKFAEAVGVQLEPERLVKILEVLRELPVPNYRTLEFLMRHLVHMASFSAQTNMHARNLAIVWAPNLLRSKDIEASGFNGTAAFMEVRVQSIVVEFILTHVDQLFGGAALSGGEVESGWRSLPGTRASGSPEDLMPRPLPYHLPSILQAGDGPPQMRPYHTIIEIAEHKRKGSLKVRKWRSIFNLGRSGHETKRKLPRGAEDREDKSNKGTLRPAKSMDSLSAAAGASDEPEGLVGPSSPRPSPLLPESLENDSIEAAEGEQEPEAEALGGTNSEPGTPRAGRSAIRAGGSSRAERCAGVHISDPYNVNLPLHITSILSVPPNIISNVSLARLTRGLECPALQHRPSPASGPGPGPGLGPGPPDEKLEASPASSPLADSGPDDLAPALEDSLSQEVQDSFSFLEDSSSSEPEWVGAEDGEVAQAEAAGAAFSPGEDDPGMGYLEELLGVGPQVEEFSVEPPLDDLSLDEAQFVLAPSCCSLDSAGPRPEVEEENGEEVFLSAYDDLSPLLGPKPPIWKGSGSLEGEAAGCGRQALGQGGEEQACWEVGEDKQAEPGGRLDIREEAEGTPQPPQPEEMEPEGQPSPDGCLCPCSLGLGGVGMRLASTLVQVQQVRSVPVVPPKPQFAKMPSAMCSKIHVAPANPCPRPGRLDGTPGERAWGSRASRSSWRNGGSLSFDAAVALARDRQRTEAQGVRRTQTCTEGGDYCLIPRTSPCSMISAHSPRPLSCLELPSEGAEGSGSRSRLSLPPREPQVPDPLLSSQRRSYAFETQANPGKGEGL
ncbi:ARHGAP30 isoform 2 [Pan troglodytes]|uniref:Rho GTPase activating protein 30 n=3 Tax=Homininae TaxID=207598 RepID=A0A0A0MRJ9_HUMAN|nr:rho GTPase-activating protein 30 isoform 2 [Homo sapiens]PNI19808.1 ARHGAP30 isoform 2 [Pan troglodytes]|eukprot:NP_859071.2 rho GTPase-activating protein 30 isoform 2 [Homo sapiens]